ncbi:Exodeoxyribonuclease VII large subunit [Jatrophihabitans endophyticus]|uniref:Exodeoxyribonuclease 7 large subunit n=1 Tax=Jatrophihabitans endophyticus TaxID=1206085 RepID=A0A1M5T352_9ACTN|nr:exodeoxyribonuclease VII large subunit [Jatrophihabitans endophyticus]SHH45171.1 Exodeoxyribonuclease VII large subunit [Jatrophihabitans endophyticus]
MARLTTSADAPVPVRVVALRLGEWIARLGEIWVDGQVAQLNRRPGMATQFLTLRDPDANVSLSVTCPRGVLPDAVGEGSRVVLRARPDFWLERGTLSMRALEVRQVGLGELLARLEALKRLLAAEGLFASTRKRPLPFLPRRIGLITGRASAAERDVVENAHRRLPGARFRVENVAMQGTNAVTEVVDALSRLDRDPEVEIVVIARGGGSVEDLLPFSNESLVRAVADARTPVVSAIGHETDTPLLDLVADLAASTPTDAGKRIVPDLADELGEIAALRRRSRAFVHARIDRETEVTAGLPQRLRHTVRQRLAREVDEIAAARDRCRRRVAALVEQSRADLGHLRARVRTLSPQATLERGYAVVRTDDGTVVREPAQVDGRLRVRVARGEFEVDPA